jgi:ribosome hibernation promoting factor
MNIDITGLSIEVTPALRDYTNNKFSKLERHFDKITNIHVTFNIEDLSQVAEATVNMPKNQIHARAESEDMYAAIDGLVDKLDRQIVKHKEKMKGH